MISLSLGDYRPQERIETPRFVVRKLLARDAKKDYATFMSSIDTIREQRGGDWPTQDFPFEEDVIDLAWHQREFELKTSFAYVVTSLDGKEFLGCLYVYPVGHPMNSAATDVPDGTDAVVNMWVSQKAFDRGFYDELYHFAEHWITEWPFRKPFFSNPLKPVK